MKKSALCKNCKRTSQTPTFVHIKMDPVRWNFISKTVKNTKQSSNWDCWCWSPWDSRGRWCSRARWWRGSSATWWAAEWRRTPSASSHRSCQTCGQCRSRRSSYRTPPLNPRNQYDVPLSVCPLFHLPRWPRWGHRGRWWSWWGRGARELSPQWDWSSRPDPTVISGENVNNYLQCQPLCPGGCETQQVNSEAEDPSVVEIAGSSGLAEVLRPV